MNPMVKPISLLLFLIFAVVVPVTKAVATEGIVINEFASDTAGSAADPDWVEIYNPLGGTIDLSLYYLEDEATNTKSLSGNLNTGDWAAFDWSKWLNKGGDTIYLKEVATDQVVDSVQYGTGGVVEPPGPGQSAGRMPDGGETWVIIDTPTKGTANFVPTPTLSPIPTSTFTPTPLPTSTPSPVPEKDLCGWFCQKTYYHQEQFLKFLFSALPFKKFWWK